MGSLWWPVMPVTSLGPSPGCLDEGLPRGHLVGSRLYSTLPPRKVGDQLASLGRVQGSLWPSGSFPTQATEE
jgi:hypothetical protein